MEPIDEQVEAEHLRHVRSLVEALLLRHDVCGQVILAGRAGRFENFTDVRASWSRLRLVETEDGRTGVGIRSLLQEDYAGDAERQKRELEWSVGMASGFGEIGGLMAVSWIDAANYITAATNAEHTPMRRDDPRDKP
jgi:hypothetical protein